MSAALGPDQRRVLLAHADGWVALGFGSGLVPWAPGTAGSLAALLPWLALRALPLPQYLLVLALAFALGVWACDRAARRVDLRDPGAFVFDEFVGQWAALLFVARGPWWAVALAFALFRLFDVWKPWPVGWLDRHLHGGLGVMADDAVAGLMAAGWMWIVLQLVYLR